MKGDVTMSVNGLDTASVCTNIANTIKKAGYVFVARYYGNYRLTLTEAKALSKAGLEIVAVWENGRPTSASYFSYDKGYSDGTSAYNYAKNNIEQPNYTPIFFAVDYDASDSDIHSVITNYFNGISAAFTNLGSAYDIGAYGSGAVLSYLYSNVSGVSYKWLAKSTGWRGHGTYTDWDIKQGSTVTVGGITFDSDTGKSYGGFQVF